METKEPVSLSNFEETVGSASPMPLSFKKEKSSYDYFLALGNSLAESIASGKSPFLPNKEGFVDLQPAYNISNNKKMEGLTQIMLLTKAAELGSTTNGFVTFETVKKAQEAGVECRIVKGSKAIVIPVVDEQKWSDIKFKNTWFNLSQIEGAENLVAFCKKQMTKQYENDLAYIKENYPNSDYAEKKNPAEYDMARPNEKTMPLNANTEKPFQYLAQVMNAVNTGRKLRVTPAQAEQFKSSMISALTAELEPGKRDVLAIQKICLPAQHLYQKSQKKLKEFYQKSSAKKPHTREPSYERGL